MIKACRIAVLCLISILLNACSASTKVGYPIVEYHQRQWIETSGVPQVAFKTILFPQTVVPPFLPPQGSAYARP